MPKNPAPAPKQSKAPAKGNPIPTRFDPPDEAALDDLNSHTGLPKAHLIQRAVKLLISEVKKRGGAGWIVTELGPSLTMLGDHPASLATNSANFPRPTTQRGTVYMPVLGQIAAGDGDSVDDLTDYHLELPARIVDGAAFALRVKGDSMNKAPEGIQNGDVVLMALRPAEVGNVVAALVSGKTTLKRVARRDGRLVLVAESDNPAHGTIYPLDEMRAQGVYVGTVPKELVDAGRVD